MKNHHPIDPHTFVGGKFAEIFKHILNDTEIEIEMERMFSLNDTLGFRSFIPIIECHEKLSHIDDPQILFFSPHPYKAAGAPYGSASPFDLRSGAVERLRRAQRQLSALHPGYRLKIFDCFRPLPVQSYMVELTFLQIATERGLDPETLGPDEQEPIYQEVFKLFARPNPDPSAPPPHSTGGAVDLTIVDEKGQPLDMGSEIDALPPCALPHHYYGKSDPVSVKIQANRDLLRTVMISAGFERLPREWWHFSYGDQMWALLQSIKDRRKVSAIYGRLD
jgi:D-alanyl-D-alanine dipeptidase